MLFSLDSVLTLCPAEVPVGDPLWAYKLAKGSFLHLSAVDLYYSEEDDMDFKTVRELFEYNAESGELTWKISPSPSAKVGDNVGSSSVRDGYITTLIKGRRYMVHRLIWLYVTGKYPEHQIDHINHDRADNRWVNLRDVTASENQRNRPISSANNSGVVGVRFDVNRQRWVSRIRHEGSYLYLGRYKSKEDAIKARKDAEVKYGYHKNCGKPVNAVQ